MAASTPVKHAAWIILVLVVVLRSPTLFESMYNGDEGYSAAIAIDMLRGGTIYKTAVDTRAPFIYYVYYGIFKIAGENNLFMVHVAAIFFIVVTAFVIRTIGVLVADDAAGAWGAIGYVVFSHTYLPRDTLAANVEIFTILPLALGMLCFLLGEQDQRSRASAVAWLFVSGVSCGVAVFFRLPSIVQLAVIGGYLLYAWCVARSITFGHAVRSLAVVLAGFAAFVGLVVVYHQIRGNWADMVEWSWTLARHYVKSETTVAYVVKRLFLVHATFIIAGALLWYFGIKKLICVIRAHALNRSDVRNTLLIALWFAASYITLFIGWRFPGHYHLMLLPPLAILAGMAFKEYVDRMQQNPAPLARRIRLFLLGAAVIPAMPFLLMAFITRESTLAFIPITQYIAATTRAGDRIFVWGSSPKIYAYSGRRMASRFASSSHLVGMYASRPHKDIDESKWIVPGSWDMLDTDLSKNTPELIVDLASISPNWDAHPMTRYPVLQRHLAHYLLETTIQGARIYRRTPSS